VETEMKPSQIREQIRPAAPKGEYVPHEVKKGCTVLGLNVDELTIESIVHARKTFVSESKIRRYFSEDMADVAQSTLIDWLRKEGKGKNKGDNGLQPAPVPKKPLPNAGAGAIALQFPESETET
jgi:hypothetical protein